MIEKIEHADALLAMIIRAEYRQPGISFFTPPELSQQLAFMRHPDDKTIDPHVHNPVHREVQYTQEVLLIRSGRLRVDFYTPEQEYIESTILAAGDVILLATGGHGFKTLGEVEMIEVKQGPYAGDEDKTRFTPISDDEVRYKDGAVQEVQSLDAD